MDLGMMMTEPGQSVTSLMCHLSLAWNDTSAGYEWEKPTLCSRSTNKIKRLLKVCNWVGTISRALIVKHILLEWHHHQHHGRHHSFNHLCQSSLFFPSSGCHYLHFSSRRRCWPYAPYCYSIRMTGRCIRTHSGGFPWLGSLTRRCHFRKRHVLHDTGLHAGGTRGGLLDV